MKFTFKGHIKIIAKFEIVQSKECIVVSVEDTGIGIKKEDTGKLF